jgi:RimJ/RimL family protein N-acetyltransferase
VALRAWVSSDAVALLVAGDDPVVRRFRPSLPANESDARDWLAETEPARLRGERLELAATDPELGAVVGGVTLWSIAPRHRGAMVNYGVAAEARGRGVATRALRLLAGWRFDEFGLARLGVFIEPENAASRAVAERCGFVHEGRLRSHGERGDGERHDPLVYGLLAGELR